MSQPSIVSISSYNANEGTNSNFTSLLPSAILNPKTVQLSKFTLLNMLYPFTLQDNILLLQVNNSTATTYKVIIPTNKQWSGIATVPAGQTSFLQDLNSALVTGLTGSGATITATWSPQTSNLTLTGNVTFKILSYDVGSTANYKLGLTLPAYSFVTSLTADGFVNLLRTGVIYVCSNLLGNSLNDGDEESIIATIPVNANYGGLITFDNKQDQNYISLTVGTIREINIRLLDEEYQLLSVPNNAYTNIEMLFGY
jgi:hypothetical protein